MHILRHLSKIEKIVHRTIAQFPAEARSFLSNMARPTVYVTRDIGPEATDLLKNHCDVTIWAHSEPVSRADLISNVQGKDALFCLLTEKIDKEVLNRAGSQLKVVATMSVGFDHLDLNELKARNVRIGYTPDVLTPATAELTIALLLATSRRLLEASEEARTGGWKAWSPFWLCGPSLNGATVGVVGFGRIGQEVAKRLNGFGIQKLLYTNQSGKDNILGGHRVPLDELLSASDFVISTCALTPETKEMFNDETFKKMKSNAVFINTSRGGVVDQDALIRALKNGTIWGAGLDVTTPEPLPLDSELFKLKNCVVLPHIGSASIETRNAMAVLTARNIVSALKGETMPSELLI
ncbi:glyoxylate reductase/hydroxypyruvate reductase-like [Photinus pyralis]|nr:glyoxylate reductase/hydroxypyruvate reductase-like [Photinus pyralis]